MTYKELSELAERARERAYAPYSGFTVGAALLCADGSVYTGCNVENASFTPTCCAERVAMFSAVADGKREFTAIAVTGGSKGESAREVCAPCGVCRQVMAELAPPDFTVIFSDGSATTLGALMPLGFSLKQTTER